jgi:UPF0716 protein FxsA
MVVAGQGSSFTFTAGQRGPFEGQGPFGGRQSPFGRQNPFDRNDDIIEGEYRDETERDHQRLDRDDDDSPEKK